MSSATSVEGLGALLFLVPRTARTGAALLSITGTERGAPPSAGAARTRP